MDNSLPMGIFEAPADRLGDGDGLLDGKAVLRGFLYKSLHVSTGQEREDDIGLSTVLAHVVDANDIGMLPEPAHGLGLPYDTQAARLIQFLGLDEGKGNIPIKDSIMG
jgi:hypothetical protein